MILLDTGLASIDKKDTSKNKQNFSLAHRHCFSTFSSILARDRDTICTKLLLARARRCEKLYFNSNRSVDYGTKELRDHSSILKING